MTKCPKKLFKLLLQHNPHPNDLFHMLSIFHILPQCSYGKCSAWFVVSLGADFILSFALGPRFEPGMFDTGLQSNTQNTFPLHSISKLYVLIKAISTFLH